MLKTVNLFIISALFGVFLLPAQAEEIRSRILSEKISPLLQVEDAGLQKVFWQVFESGSIPPDQGFAFLLKSPDISLSVKIRYLQMISGSALPGQEIIKILREVSRANCDNLLGSCAGLLAMRNNPAFWLDEEYLRMDKNKFLDLLAGRSLNVSEEEKRFSGFLDVLAREKESFLKNDPEKWSYPYSCTYLSGKMLGLIKSAGFTARMEVRQFPDNSGFFGVHAYVVVTIQEEEFVVDFTATQFHKIDHDTFQETGIAVIPVQDIRQSPEKFIMYARGPYMTFNAPRPWNSSFEGVGLEIMRRMIGGVEKKPIVFVPGAETAAEIPAPARAILGNLSRLIAKANKIPDSIDQFSVDFLNRQEVLLKIYKNALDYLSQLGIFEQDMIIYPFIGADAMPAAYLPTIGIDVSPEAEYSASMMIATLSRDTGIDAEMMRKNLSYARRSFKGDQADGRDLGNIRWPREIRGQKKIFFIKGLMKWANFSPLQQRMYLTAMEGMLDPGDKVIFFYDGDGDEAPEYLQEKGSFKALNKTQVTRLNDILSGLKAPSTNFGESGMLIPNRVMILEKSRLPASDQTLCRNNFEESFILSRMVGSSV